MVCVYFSKEWTKLILTHHWPKTFCIVRNWISSTSVCLLILFYCLWWRWLSLILDSHFINLSYKCHILSPSISLCHSHYSFLSIFLSLFLTFYLCCCISHPSISHPASSSEHQFVTLYPVILFGICAEILSYNTTHNHLISQLIFWASPKLVSFKSDLSWLHYTFHTLCGSSYKTS